MSLLFTARRVAILLAHPGYDTNDPHTYTKKKETNEQEKKTAPLLRLEPNGGKELLVG